MALYKQYFGTECLLINGLGPTESTLALQYFIDHDTETSYQVVPVGYPVPETQIKLLDEAGQETDLYGENAIYSPYVALGYWRNPAQDRRCLFRNG